MVTLIVGREEDSYRAPGDASEAAELPLCEEAPVTIFVNDREVVTLLCTPRDLRDLTFGWLFAEGLLTGPGDVLSVAGCLHSREMYVCAARESAAYPEKRRPVTSGCGAVGDRERLQHGPLRPVGGSLRLPAGRLRELMREMLRGASLYHETGGVHSAALASAEGIVVQREDIGRHNAVDKVIGYALQRGLPFGDLALLATGRLSSEMVWKAAAAGLPVVASLSLPSTLARDLAAEAGLTLVGRALASTPLVYTSPWRIT